MKIPKYIEKALNDRVKAANKWTEADMIIGRFLIEKGLEEKVETYDLFGGVEGIVNPEESVERIREVIKEA